MAVHIRRREFVFTLGGAAAGWPLAAGAQQPAMPVVAFINVGSLDTRRDRVDAFRKGLSETGYTERQNVSVEYHWLDGRYLRLPEVLDEVIRRRVDVIAIPGSGPAVLAAKAATATIPIVFGVAENPVSLGLVKSLAQPGGNATGINFFSGEIDAKRLGLMHELLPKASRFGVLVNPANVRYTEATLKHCVRPRTPSTLNSSSSMPALRLKSTLLSLLLRVSGRKPSSLQVKPFFPSAVCSLPR